MRRSGCVGAAAQDENQVRDMRLKLCFPFLACLCQATFHVFADGAFDPPRPQRLRLDGAEVGFRAHFGVSKVYGMDVTQTEMSGLSVTTNGDGSVEAVWRGHPVFGEDFFIRAGFVRKGSVWEYSCSCSI